MRLGLAVASGLGLFLDAVDTALDGLQISQLQLQVNDLLVAHGIHGAVNMGHIIVVEATQHMDDGIGLTNVTQEFVSQALTTAGSLHQSGDVDDFDRRGHDARGIHQLGELVETLVGNGDNAHIGLDGAEREVGRLRLGIRQAIKQG